MRLLLQWGTFLGVLDLGLAPVLGVVPLLLLVDSPFFEFPLFRFQYLVLFGGVDFGERLGVQESLEFVLD